MADENYYPEAEDQEAPESPEVEESENEEGEDEEASETTLVPKSILDGREVKPGDTLSFKVKSIYEDEVEVEAMDNESEEPAHKGSGMDEAMGKIDQMGG